MNEPKKNNSINNLWGMLLFLILLSVFFGGGKYTSETTAIRQEIDGLHAEQFIDLQSKAKKATSINQCRSIIPLHVRACSANLLYVLHLVENKSFTEAPPPGFGQQIVSFLAQSQPCHKTSDKPHLFSC